ncbi:MAG: hypothetical protein KF729_34735 [Sandaracinaceae bacterium]|nr:hypothetical protein [Sandaracinaceae bacterium]
MRSTGGLLLLLLPLLGGCLSVRTETYCDPRRPDASGSPRDCRACRDDAECTFQGNVCEGVVFCAHRDVALVSTDLGCVPEPPMPSRERCGCRDGYCQVR